MTVPTGEPTTEEEAQALRGHLERGAEVNLDEIRRFPAAPARLNVPNPVTLPFPNTENIAKELDTLPAGTIALVTAEFTPPERPTYGVAAFINNPAATDKTSPTDSGFAGTLAFFGPAEHGDAHRTERFRLEVTDLVRRPANAGPATLTLVPLGYPDDPMRPAAMDVTATLELAQSTVRR